MSGPVVTRAQVLAYRVVAQQLDRSATSLDALAVLDIGVQEAMGVPARLAFDARLDLPVASDVVGPGRALAYAWSLRGAPHVHRRGDLDLLAGALYPLSEADAAQRLNETGPSVRRQGIAAGEQFSIAVQAMRAAVTVPTAKGAVSTAVTQAIPPPMRRECRPCGTSHISDSAMRATLLAAGLELQGDTAPPVLTRRPGAQVVTAPDLTALSVLARRYLTLLGPATSAEVAAYLGARRVDVERAWPVDLVEVSVDGSRCWLPAERLAELRTAPEVQCVRLLGGFDPYLQARDRELIVPDKAVQKALWPVLGRPGAVLVDGEVVGTWRPTTSARTLSVSVAGFAPIAPHVWANIVVEAERMAAARDRAAVVKGV